MLLHWESSRSCDISHRWRSNIKLTPSRRLVVYRQSRRERCSRWGAKISRGVGAQVSKHSPFCARVHGPWINTIMETSRTHDTTALGTPGIIRRRRLCAVVDSMSECGHTERHPQLDLRLLCINFGRAQHTTSVGNSAMPLLPWRRTLCNRIHRPRRR